MTTSGRHLARPGFTLVELLITMVIMVIVISAIGVVLFDSQRGWNYMYNRLYSDVVADSYAARKKFDAVMRKASAGGFLLGDSGSSIEVYYYASGGSVVVDRYARFYEADGALNLEYGRLSPRETFGVETVCANVSNCTFTQAGRSAQMLLTLDDGTQTKTVVSSAVTHN